MDAIYGMTMEQLAETMSKHGELRTQHGEKQGMIEFDRYLAERGFDQHTWSLAHNGWHDRFKADPTGRAEAQFHAILAQLSAKAHFGDVRDMSQDTEEGITLDQYAQITVAVSRAGADADAIVRQFGLQNVDHWQRANAAWTAKMAADTSMKLTMQFGTLYQKHAGPAFQAEQIAQTAAIFASANAPQDVVDEPQEELTPELCLRKMQSPSRNERWKYAGLYAHMADLGNVPNKLEAIATVAPILIDMIEQHDEHTTSDAENGARKLWDLGVRGDDFRGAIGRCLNRAKEKLASVQAAFAPIQNQAVPERVTLQARIQDYQSLVDTMTEYLAEDWGAGGAGNAMAAAAPAFAPAPSFGGAPPSPGFGAPAFGAPSGGMHAGGMPMPAPSSSGGFPKWILAPVILAVVGGGFYVVRGRNAAKEAAAAAASASVTSASVASAAPPAAKSAAAATASASGAAPAAAPAAKAKPGKKK